MPDALEPLLDSLLYEGYALYPYTPGTAKNATPTPFGIVYPPAYAAECPGAHDHARLECLIEGWEGARLTATLHFLVATGTRHEATRRRVEISPLGVGESATGRFAGGRFTLRSEPRADGSALVRACVHNEARVEPGLGRAAALERALISVQIVVRATAGRFRSPLEAECRSVNTFPVLAAVDDRTVLGTTIVLPDHPQIAPESRGSLFDATEIEEALLLHVHALSDGEREEISRPDPAVREMIARAAAATPQDIMALHGRVTVRDPETVAPPAVPPGLADPTLGEEAVEVAGVRYARGDHVLIHPGPGADLHARLLDGRSATIERIFIELDGRVHLGVTVDGEPGQELLRETARYLFFFPEEVEVK